MPVLNDAAGRGDSPQLVPVPVPTTTGAGPTELPAPRRPWWWIVAVAGLLVVSVPLGLWYLLRHRLGRAGEGDRADSGTCHGS